jgi:hypothetical protein
LGPLRIRERAPPCAVGRGKMFESVDRLLHAVRRPQAFEFVRLRWRVRQWQRKIRADEEGTRQAVEKAKARGASQAEIDEITGGEVAGVPRWKLREAMSDYLISKAHRLIIPLPPDDDEKMWTIVDDNSERKYVLTYAGINELRNAIRAELKGKIERWLMLTSGLVGVIGAITGLVAVIKK